MLFDVSSLYGYKKNNGIYIISFWNNKSSIFGGIHTVAVKYNRGVFTVYNRYNNVKSEYKYSSFEAIFKKGRFIVGYYLT